MNERRGLVFGVCGEKMSENANSDGFGAWNFELTNACIHLKIRLETDQYILYTR